MPYITIKQQPVYHQISFEEMIVGVDDLTKYVQPNISNTRTYYAKKLNQRLLDNTDIQQMIALLSVFNTTNEALFDKDRASLYNSFPIPKNSGGFRRIDAPLPEISEPQRKLRALLQVNMFALYHTTAFAYIRGRCTVDAVKKHQQNESKWFLKLDFSDFFGSTTPDFVLSILSEIFPFSEIVKDVTGKDELARALDLCFLNGGLPQGTPISPMLTNLIMIPIDHKLSNTLRNFDKKRFVYTRYADDLLISCKYGFDKDAVQSFVLETLREFNAPYIIKPEKVRYGSNAGKNWNLGVMLNKDNEITIGHRKKKHFKAALDNYIRAKKSGGSWELYDVQVLNGLISYYRSIEKDYIDYILNTYSEKNQYNIMKNIKADLKLSA